MEQTKAIIETHIKPFIVLLEFQTKAFENTRCSRKT